jgi:hypothetical protein
MFDVVFALNGIANIVKRFEVNEHFQALAFGEAIDETRTMLEHPTDQIARNSNVQNAVRPIGQNVDVPTCHADSLQDVDGRDRPGHDESP